MAYPCPNCGAPWTRHVPRTDCKHIIRVEVEKMTGQDSDACKKVAAMLKGSGFKPEVINSLLLPTVTIDPNTGQYVPIKPKPAAGGRKFR
jgi:hypothetical protein